MDEWILNLKSARLTYRIMSRALFDDVKATMNDEVTCNNSSLLSWPLTDEQVTRFCDRAEQGLENKDEYIFISYYDDKPAGHLGLYVKEPSALGEVGYWVVPEFRGQGFATEMAAAGTQAIFEHLHLPKAYASAALHNIASHKALLKNGFIEDEQRDIECADGSMRPSKIFVKNAP